MDNQKYSTQITVYKELLTKKPSQISAIAKRLELDEKVVLKAVAQLKSMGVGVLHKACPLINISAIKMDLLKAQVDFPIHYFFSTDSTNIQAQKINANALIIAEHQTQGQGRRQKQWVSALGQSITMSLIYHFDKGLVHLSGLNIVAGVAIINTLKKFDIHSIGLKWPNDIISEKAKVAGILIEISGNKSKSKAIIGIGINWQLSNELLDSVEQNCDNIPANNLTRNQFISALVIEIDKLLSEFKINLLKNILPTWHEFDRYKNKKIHILSQGEKTLATYIGVDKKGLLQVSSNQQIKTISSAQVSIRPQ